MGFVRLMLAICVVGSHTSVPIALWIGGREAVLAFYMISGFLITLVLHRAYRDRPLAFYGNRVLRIYGPAFVTFVLVLFFHWLLGIRNGLPQSGVLWADIFSAITDVSLVGQDLAWLFAIGPDGLPLWQPIGTVGLGKPYLYELQINAPLFTLAIELYFYALAPFVVRTLPRALCFAAFGTAYHLALHVSGSASVGLSYQFFPASWFYFGAGSLAYYCSVARGGSYWLRM